MPNSAVDMVLTGRSKRAIEDHFDKAYELESELAQKNILHQTCELYLYPSV